MDSCTFLEFVDRHNQGLGLLTVIALIVAGSMFSHWFEERIK